MSTDVGPPDMFSSSCFWHDTQARTHTSMHTHTHAQAHEHTHTHTSFAKHVRWCRTISSQLWTSILQMDFDLILCFMHTSGHLSDLKPKEPSLFWRKGSLAGTWQVCWHIPEYPMLLFEYQKRNKCKNDVFALKYLMLDRSERFANLWTHLFHHHL